MSISNLADVFRFDKAAQIVLEPYLGQTASGQRRYGPAKTYVVRIEESQKPIFTLTGQQVMSASIIEMYPRATDGTLLTNITADDRVTLPDGTQPRIIRAGSVPDFAGAPIFWRIFT